MYKILCVSLKKDFKIRFLKILYFFILIFSVSFSFAQATWIGKGSSTNGTGTDFNNASNWSGGVPNATTDVIIAFVNDGTITLSNNAAVRNLTITVTGTNNKGILDVINKTLVVNGTTNVDILSGNNNTALSIGVNDNVSGGVIDFVGNASFGMTNLGDSVYLIGNTNSKLIFRRDLNVGIIAATKSPSEPGTLLFDGTGLQNYISNSFKCRFKNYTVGSTLNFPIVTLSGTSFSNILENLTVNEFSTLDLNVNQLNRHSNGGTFILKRNSKLKLGASASLPNGGLATLNL